MDLLLLKQLSIIKLFDNYVSPLVVNKFGTIIWIDLSKEQPSLIVTQCCEFIDMRGYKKKFGVVMFFH